MTQPPAQDVTDRFALVALEQGIDAAPAGLTYRVPAGWRVQVGQRVMVPLGRSDRPVSGYVVSLSDQTDLDRDRIKPLVQAPHEPISLTPDLMELARWISGYYCCPLGMVLATMLPAAVKRQTGITTRTQVRLLNRAGHCVPGPDSQSPAQQKLTNLQRAVLDAATDQWIDQQELADAAGAKTLSPVKQLIDRGLLETRAAQVVVSDLDLRAAREKLPGSRFTLTARQQSALDELIAGLGQFAVHLLHGVTGSGKTEVYLRLIDALLDRVSGVGYRVSGKTEGNEPLRETRNPKPETRYPISDTRYPLPGVIILVPEIALTPQTVARFTHRFDDVAVLHSGLTAAQRHHQWRRIHDGQAHIVVGARSAVFAPLDNLQLIIVDEEHESSYKQDQLPRYHARDVAIKRAQIRGIPVVLGSATPSLESYYNAKQRGSFKLLSIPDRVAGMRLPQVEVVDMTEQRRLRRGIHLLSIPLEQQLEQVTTSGGQAMLLLNRRGYANYIACPDHRCGWMMTCKHCDVTMVYHKDKHLPSGGVVRCHHCGAEQVLPTVCPDSGHKVTVFGLGTQKVEEELAVKLPQARTLRMDSDSMRRAADYQKSLDDFRGGEVDILLGTQMIAKGLDFPNVRLVGVISADTSLHLPDFRAEERTFQLIAQVAGRAGRSDRMGRVVVQTFNPKSSVIAWAAAHDFVSFAEDELQKRRDQSLPPISRMARIVVRDKDPVVCHKRAAELHAHLVQFNRQLDQQVRLFGPWPCPIARLADYHRREIVMIADGAGVLQKLMTALRNSRLLISDRHTAVDVDPVAMM
ncbi:MAG: primosomal protein N' [Phycisphaeraceae bacterium]|nr:primosomal protein N' [Phycisphaeraceae bacterium]